MGNFRKPENEVIDVHCMEGEKQRLRFLIDTGSQLCMIKLSSVKPGIKFDPEGKMRIKGISSEITETLGSVVLNLQVGNLRMKHRFQLVPENLDIPYDGLVGSDLWKRYRAIVDYEKREVKVGGHCIKILTVAEESSYLIRGRTEQIIRVKAMCISPEIREGCVSKKEVCDGVYLPNGMVKIVNGHCYTSIVNTTDKDINISIPNVRVESLPAKLHENVTGKIRLAQESENTDLKQRIKLLRETLRIEELNAEEKSAIEDICIEYNDIFHLEGDKLTQTNAREYKIRLREPSKHNVVCARPYKLPESQRQVVKEMTDKMLADGILERSDSEWNFPLILVSKKMDASGKQKYRLCIDFRLLNAQCVGNAYPLPLINDILERLGKAKYFTSLDLASGYHQCPLREEDREKTAFSTPFDHFQFKVMPMGLTGATEFFQKLMNTVLSGLQGVRSLVYLDDIVCFGSSLSDHNESVKQVFERLRKFNLKLQPDKCEFLRKEIIYLGHKITTEGVLPDPSKVECVKNYPRPETAKQLKSYVGFVSYYRKFIPNFGKIARPLHDLLLKDVPFEWGAKQELAFCELREKLISEPLLQYPDYEKEFLLTTDASGTAIGAVLSQGEIGKDLPIAYASRTLNKAEKRYSVSEAEMLACVWGVQYFRQYLYGRHFKIVTDHRPLCWAFKMSNPSSRLTRWRLKLEEYQYQIVYKPGILNSNADALSRIRRVETRQDKAKKSRENGNDVTEEELGIELEQLGPYNSIVQEEQNSAIETEEKDSSLESEDATENENEDGDKLSESEKLDIIKEYHDTSIGGHVGTRRTYEKLKTYIKWTNMQSDIEKYIKHCEKCQKNKVTGKSTKQPMVITNTPNSVFEACSIDIVGPWCETDQGHKYILTFQDSLSKFVVAVPVRSQDANTIARAFVEHVILKYGIPGSCLSDRGANFLSDIFKRTCRLLGVTRICTLAFRPQSNGSVERSHRVLTEYLRHFIRESQTDWDTWINYATFVYNTTPSVATKYTPFEMLYGRRVNLPGLLQKKPEQVLYNPDDYVRELKLRLQASAQIAKGNLIHAKETSKEYYDKTQNVVKFQVKDKVMLYDESIRKGRSRKLRGVYVGPYEVIKVEGSNVIIKIKKNKVQKVHANRLKLFF